MRIQRSSLFSNKRLIQFAVELKRHGGLCKLEHKKFYDGPQVHCGHVRLEDGVGLLSLNCV